ncbi:MAG: hypothetical protein ACTSQY_02670 [Candidatus Odinarchaeia archaeon]
MSQQLKCAKCGSTNVEQVDDKTKILSHAAHIPIYAKKYICNSCGNEWE